MFDEYAPDDRQITATGRLPGMRLGPALRYAGMKLPCKIYVWADGWELCPIRSQLVYNHSPDGFNWGYGGSGPSQLALAVMLHEGLSDREALWRYVRFTSKVIAAIDEDHWVIPGAEVRQWIHNDRLKFPLPPEGDD